MNNEQSFQFAEHCVNNLDRYTLIRQQADYKFQYFKIKVVDCDPRNT